MYYKWDICKVFWMFFKIFFMVLIEVVRCLSFKYLYIDVFYDDGYDVLMVFKYRNLVGIEFILFIIGIIDVSYNFW